MGFTKNKKEDSKERVAFSERADAAKEVAVILEKFSNDDDKLDILRMAGLVIPPKPSPFVGILG